MRPICLHGRCAGNLRHHLIEDPRSVWACRPASHRHGVGNPACRPLLERDASGAEFARPAALIPAALGLATPPPAAIPGWPFSNVPQRRRVVGHQANCVNCVHAPRTPPHGLVLPLPQPCMLPRLSQSRKHARIDFCMVSAADKLRANDDVRSHDAGLTTRSPTGTADNSEHDQPKLEPK